MASTSLFNQVVGDRFTIEHEIGEGTQKFIKNIVIVFTVFALINLLSRSTKKAKP